MPGAPTMLKKGANLGENSDSMMASGYGMSVDLISEVLILS